MILQPQGNLISHISVQDISHSQATHSNLLSSQVTILSICSQQGENYCWKRSKEMEITIKLKKNTSISQSTQYGRSFQKENMLIWSSLRRIFS